MKLIRKYNNILLYLLSTYNKEKCRNRDNVARTKTKKFRGSMTHGKGKKAGRGAGLRGGRGNAGLHKHRYMHMLKYMPNHFGVHGFKRPQGIIKKEMVINVGQLDEAFPGKKDIDLTKEGIDKLLGGGTIKSSMKITVNAASVKAIEKIEGKGGKVILPKVTKEESVEGPEKSGKK